MCRAVTCKTCDKTTWSGCGQHISQVRASVPAAQWCDGQHTAAERAGAGRRSGGLLRRLFSRR